MAIYPNEPFASKEVLQPGARGDQFMANMPGFRDGEKNRVQRTNTHLNVSEHDVPNCKWDLDYRLPVLFRYGWGYGFNQIISPKGRIFAKVLGVPRVIVDKFYLPHPSQRHCL